MDPPTFSVEGLSRRCGQPVERLREWQRLGLIGAAGADDFTAVDVVRARLHRLLIHHGIDLEAAGGWVRSAEGASIAVLLTPQGARAYTLAEAAPEIGVKAEQLARLWEAAGFQWDTPLDDEAIEALRMWKAALDAGFPEDAMVQLVRLLRDVMQRVADTQVHLFHVHIRPRLEARGLADGALDETLGGAVDELSGLARSALLHFHRRALREAIQEAAVMEAAERAGLRRASEVPGQVEVAIVFVDLASSTPLVEAMGDLKMAEVLERFSVLVRRAVARHDGHVVKQIGDAFMLVFHTPRAAVACAVDIEAAASREPQFPAVRGGGHWGRALYREGDYLGGTVNLAARLADEAGRHQVLVTEAVRRAADGLPDAEFVPLGSRRLRGVTRPVELFEARASSTKLHARAVDPVCGMELGPAEVRARLAVGSRERVFCSEECLRRYAAAPERYETT